MELRVISKDGIKCIRNLKIGELILCESNVFMPIKSILVIASSGSCVRLSDNFKFNIHPRLRIKTSSGFKYPEIWDTVPISKNFTPMVTSVNDLVDIRIFYDILIDGNILSPEGIVFKFGD